MQLSAPIWALTSATRLHWALAADGFQATLSKGLLGDNAFSTDLRHFRSVEHRVQQNIAPCSDVSRLGVFYFVVTDAVFAGDEDHAARGQTGGVDGIVPGA
jgi:hypothetical protein